MFLQYGKGIYLDTANNNVISNMYFEHNDASVALKRPSSNNVVQDCEFYDTKHDFLWESVKGGSVYETAPVTIFETTDESGRGLVIRRNRCKLIVDLAKHCFNLEQSKDFSIQSHLSEALQSVTCPLKWTVTTT